jgi:sulfofructose kinase
LVIGNVILSASFDVLGLGAVAVDELIYVDSYPPPDEKAHVVRTERQCGGLTATALVAAARFGAKCAYAGVLGDDDLSQFAIERMREEGIDLANLLIRPATRPVHSYIIIDQERATRNIFADARGAVGADDAWPEPEVIRASRVLFVDHFGLAGMRRAAQIARENGIPVAADLERECGPEFRELFALVDHVVISWGFARELTGAASPAEAVERLYSRERDTVAVTAGEKGCWYKAMGLDAEVHHQPAFAVNVVDTTGCGDVFHGIYAAALAEGLPPRRRILLASAAAALKATQPGGQTGIPTRKALEDFFLAL